MILRVDKIFPNMNSLGLLLMMLPMSCALKPCSKDGKPCISRHFKNVSLGMYLSYLFGDSVSALRPPHCSLCMHVVSCEQHYAALFSPELTAVERIINVSVSLRSNGEAKEVMLLKNSILL